MQNMQTRHDFKGGSRYLSHFMQKLPYRHVCCQPIRMLAMSSKHHFTSRCSGGV